MIRYLRYSLLLPGLFVAGWTVVAAEPPAAREPRQTVAPVAALAEFRTVDTALTSHISRMPSKASHQPGYIGIHVEPDSRGKLVIAQVEPDSPAAQAGLQVGDVLRQVAGHLSVSVSDLHDALQSRTPGETVKVGVLRKDKPVDLNLTLDSPSHPLSVTTPRGFLGVQLRNTTEEARIASVTANSPAAEAGLKVDDVILQADGKAIGDPDRFRQFVGDRRAGELLALLIKREGKDEKITIKLGIDKSAPPPVVRWDDRAPFVWKKDVYHLAVVPIEYPDVKHNAVITAKDWAQALFSKATYTAKSVTGQKVHGSLNDYYLEQSCGKFHVEGKVFPFVEAGKKRAEYNSTPNRYALFTEALDKLLARDGKDALQGFDGLFFLYAGDRFPTTRGSLYWPHRATMNYKGHRWSYFICPEGGEKISTISVIAHEFGHMIGLPDLYARPEKPDYEGLGTWCTMATGHGRTGKPVHFCAWSKEQLGWLRPVVIDPAVPQKLILSPVENSTRECFKVLIHPDGSEYLLLENRLNRGFDRDLPGEGLLIWRVVDNKPILEEAHGITTPEGPYRFKDQVPYPNKANNSFTPYTTPSSKSTKGGGLPVHITNIRRLPDGRITFWIGYEYL